MVQGEHFNVDVHRSDDNFYRPTLLNQKLTSTFPPFGLKNQVGVTIPIIVESALTFIFSSLLIVRGHVNLETLVSYSCS